MYAWIWRRLPGSQPVRLGTAVALIAVVVALLWYFAFPWLEARLLFDHGVVTPSPSPAP